MIWSHSAYNNNKLLLVTVEKCSDMIGPECADNISINYTLATFYKNLWCGFEKEPATTIEDDTFISKDNILHSAGMWNEWK